MNTTEKTYQPQAIEQQWYKEWEAKGYFAPSGKGDAFCIMLPPPNVTGSLHMGHGFGFTLIDILVRYERMCSKNTLWQPGTDHAGISTQMVVERQIMAKGESRHSLGREKFVEKIWEWKAESGGNITRQMRRLGSSVDWSRERFTLDEDLSHAVREVFINLYNEGLIYRGTKLVNWDPVLLTAISDLEVINEEEDGKLWYIRYPIVDSNNHLVVATTRPETMLGDAAVAVNPNDERYQALIGKHVQLPLTDRTIPIIADDYVDPAFGTGCVKITPAHDFNDYAIGSRHDLTPINIFTPTASINENAPSTYQGLDRFKAREKVIADLTALDLIEKIDKHQLKVPRGEKTGAIIEPYLTPQWFMRMQPLAEPAIKVVEQGKLRFIPEGWNKTYFQWLNNIEDWCISRQLWWGHRIPVWYDDSGNTYVGQDEQDARKRHNLSADIALSQDQDVLDTWFSSALWPFSTLGWPNNTQELNTFFPTSVLVTGFDIIFFWVARMIMLSLKFTDNIPFKDVYITGLIRDAEGHKMSKSKGNVLDPIDMIDGISLEELIKKRTYGLMQPRMAEKIEKNTRKEFPEGIPSYGTDALRFTYSAIASYTRDISFDTHRLGGARNFCNKIWNAARYVQMNTGGQDTGISNEHMQLSLPDRWIRSRLQQTIQKAHESLADYRFDLYAQTLYDFTWNEFCDWYLELSKPVLTSPESSPELLRGTRHTLVNTLEALLRLLHPIMPFVTEELWQRIAPLAGVTGETIMLATYPEYNAVLVDEEATKEISWLKEMIMAIRSIRSEMNIPPSKRLTILLRHGDKQDRENETKHHAFLKNLAKLESIEWLGDNASPPPSATALIGKLEIFIPMAGFINVEEEQARLSREISKAEKELTQINNKLKNTQFIERAPAEVVAKEQARHAELEMIIDKLKQQVELIN